MEAGSVDGHDFRDVVVVNIVENALEDGGKRSIRIARRGGVARTFLNGLFQFLFEGARPLLFLPAVSAEGVSGTGEDGIVPQIDEGGRREFREGRAEFGGELPVFLEEDFLREDEVQRPVGVEVGLAEIDRGLREKTLGGHGPEAV